NGTVLFCQLAPGIYLLEVSGWDKGKAAAISYKVALTFITQNDNAPPLLTGPAPAVAILLDTAAPPAPVSSPPPVPTPPVPTPPRTRPPRAPPPPVAPPPVAPPATSPSPTDSSPVSPPSSSGTDPSAIAGGPGALTIAIPPELQGGPTSAVASPLSLAALGTG